VRDGGTGEQYFIFFKNAIRWLVGDPSESLVDLEVSQNQIQEGERAQIVVRARDRSYKENANAPLKIRVERSPDGRVVWEREGKTDATGRYSTGFPLEKKGHYFATAQVRLKEGTWVKGETIVAVEGMEGEWAQPQINAPLLEDLARKTQGAFHVLPKKIDVRVRPQFNQQVLDRRLFPLWDTWGMLLLISLFLCGEWWLRKRAGLA
jgi:hypothetical protein